MYWKCSWWILFLVFCGFHFSSLPSSLPETGLNTVSVEKHQCSLVNQSHGEKNPPPVFIENLRNMNVSMYWYSILELAPSYHTQTDGLVEPFEVM